MAFANTNVPTQFRNVLATPFYAFGRMLVRMSEGSSHMRQVNQLNALSDADLAAMNTTRRNEIERIFAAHMHI